MNPLLMIIIAILLPPLAVFLQKGAGKDFVINVLLSVFLLWIGGIIHAIWLQMKK